MEQTYEQYKIEQSKLAQSQANDKYKKDFKRNVQPIKKVNKKINKALQRTTKSGGKLFTNASKAYKPTAKLSQTLAAYGQAFSGPTQKTAPSRGKVGKPLGFRKWRSPFNNQPIDAPEYYKQMRLFRKIQAQKASVAQQQTQQQYAQQGVPPNQIQQTIQARLAQQQQIQQMQQQRQVPMQYQRPNIPVGYPPRQQQIPVSPNNVQQLQNGTVVPMGNSIWKFQRGIVGQEGGLFGPVKKLYGAEMSFWN